MCYDVLLIIIILRPLSSATSTSHSHLRSTLAIQCDRQYGKNRAGLIGEQANFFTYSSSAVEPELLLPFTGEHTLSIRIHPLMPGMEWHNSPPPLPPVYREEEGRFEPGTLRMSGGFDNHYTTWDRLCFMKSTCSCYQK